VNQEDTEQGRHYRAWINPLQFHSAVEPALGTSAGDLTEAAVLNFICTPGVAADLRSLTKRFRTISKEKVRLVAAPSEERILAKLIWPLRNAKASYMVGNFLGTISLCAAVAETVAILLLDLREIEKRLETGEDADGTLPLVSRHENLARIERIRELRERGIIDDGLGLLFDLVRSRRQRYLPLWPDDRDTIPEDAVEAYHATVAIVVHAIGQDLGEGTIQLQPALVRYLAPREMARLDDIDELF